MRDCIEGVKNSVADFVAGLTSIRNVPIDWRARLIGYRDLEEGEPTESHEFTSDPDAFRAQIATLDHKGGGDIPESTLDAIYVASHSAWRDQCHRFVVVFTDAPAKEMHPSTVAAGEARDVHHLAQTLIANRIQLFLFAPETPEYTVLEKVPESIYETVESDTGLREVDFAALLERIGKTVAQSSVVAAE